MAWRPEHLVLAGELDNTQPGWTVGWIALDGVAERLQLKLAGNCHPDLAGWKFRIKRTEPALPKDFDGEDPPNYAFLSQDQSGHVGDITADQTVKHFDLPDDELVQRLLAGEKPPFTWRKCLYLEWFSNRNGRVVIQSTRLEVERWGERSFELTEEQWREQHRQNQQEMSFFMTQLGDALENGSLDEDDA
jgi:hypothetical protein